MYKERQKGWLAGWLVFPLVLHRGGGFIELGESQVVCAVVAKLELLLDVPSWTDGRTDGCM